MSYFRETPRRVTHRIDSSRDMRKAPKTSDRKPSKDKPAPLIQKSRCASCGGRHR